MFILSDEIHARKTCEEDELVLIRTEPNGIPTYIILSLVEVSECSSSNADCFVKGMDDISENWKSTFYTEKANCEKKKQYQVILMIEQAHILDIEEFWYSLKQHGIDWLWYTVSIIV